MRLLWKKRSKTDSPAAEPGNKVESKPVDKPGFLKRKPTISQVVPRAAIPGGEVGVWGSGFVENGNVRPVVRFGEQPASVVVSSSTRLVVRVPDGVTRGDLTVDSGTAVSAPVAVAVGTEIAENLHPVANPAIDAEATS